MNRPACVFRHTIISIFLCTVCSIPLSSQPTHNQESTNSFSLEIQKPFFKNSEFYSYWGFFLSSRIALSQDNRLYLTAEIPLAVEKSHSQTWETEYFSFTLGKDMTETYIGNPYIGLYKKLANPNFSTVVGLRVPILTEFKGEGVSPDMAFFSSFDRVEAFVPDVLPIYGSLTYTSPSPSNYSVSIKGGSITWMDIGDSMQDEFEVFLTYSVRVDFLTDKFFLGGIFAGRVLITEPDLSFSDRSVHTFGLNAGLNLNRMRPSVYIRFPLEDDQKDLIDLVVGGTMAIIL